MRARPGLVALAVLAGCTLDFDNVTPSGGFGGGGATGASSQVGGEHQGASNQGGSEQGGSSGGGAPPDGGAPPCSTPCEPLPNGFVGFVSLGAPGGCSEPTIDGGVVDTSSPITAPAATCNCGCKLGPVTKCADTTNVTLYSGSDCTMSSSEVSPLVEGCNNVGAVQSTHSLEPVWAGAPFGHPCVSDGIPATKPTVTFNAPIAGCDLAEGECGDHAACLDPGVNTCVWKLSDGAGTCPLAFPNPVSVVTQAGLIDDRTCTCTCPVTTVTCAPPTLLYYENADCSSLIDGTDNGAQTCWNPNLGEQIRGLKLTTNPVGTCGAPTTQTSRGGVTSTPDFFLCCTEPAP